MKVKIGNKIFDSFETPIAVLLNDEEIKAASELGAKGRAIGSFPVGYDRLAAMVFVNEGWSTNAKVRVNTQSILSKLELPDTPNLRIG